MCFEITKTFAKGYYDDLSWIKHKWFLSAITSVLCVQLFKSPLMNIKMMQRTFKYFRLNKHAIRNNQLKLSRRHSLTLLYWQSLFYILSLWYYFNNGELPNSWSRISQFFSLLFMKYNCNHMVDVSTSCL